MSWLLIIRESSTIATGSLLTKDVDIWSIVAGVPAELMNIDLTKRL